MANCKKTPCCTHTTIAAQSMEEMEFERGIWFAALCGDLSQVKKLLNRPLSDVDQLDGYDYTALHYAARNGHLDICKYLVENGADVNKSTRSALETPLHKASSAGHLEVVKYLISKNATPLACNADGDNCLHKAASANRTAVCEYLEEHFPEMKDAVNKRGKLPYD